MRHLTFTLFFSLWLSIAIVACDDSTSGDSNSDDTNSGNTNAASANISASVDAIETDTVLEEASEEQAMSLCEAQNTYLMSQISESQMMRAGCAISTALTLGFAMDEDAPNCDEIYTACLEADNEMTEDEMDPCADAASSLSECSATVGELEACLEEQVNGFLALSSLTCDDLSDPEVLTSMDSDTAMSACDILREKCPNFGQ